MARRLILDWRSDQLVALVTKDALDVAFEASYVINDLPHGNVPMASIDAAREPLRRMIQELGLRRVATTVLLGREFFELQPIVLPPAPESDWPDMVAFQAPQAFTSLRDDGVLDFVPLPAAQQGTTELLVAAISRQVRDALVNLAQHAGLRLEHISPRPLSSAHVGRVLRWDRDTYWLLDLQAGSADITLIEHNRVLLTRSVRWNREDVAEGVSTLQRELLRTRTAAPPPQQYVTDTVLCGPSAVRTAWSQRQTEGGPDVPRFVEWDRLVTAIGGACDVDLLSAAAVGAAYESATQQAPLIDFLHPRQRPIPVNVRTRARQWSLAGTAVVLAGVALFWWQLDIRDQRILTLQRELQDLKKEESRYTEPKKQLAEVERWTGKHVNWLEQLHHVVSAMPPAEQLQLVKLTVLSKLPGGEITLEGRADSLATLESLESRLQTDVTQPMSNERRRLAESERFAWSFKEQIFVKPSKVISDSTSQVQPTTREAPTSVDSPPDSETAKKPVPEVSG